jgi:hypothetical protein
MSGFDGPVDRYARTFFGAAVGAVEQRKLAGAASAAIFPTMFVVTEADAAAIRAVYEQEGELSAAIELRRRFPGIIDNAKARQCARSIAGWTPAVPAATVMPMRPRKRRP